MANDFVSIATISGTSTSIIASVMAVHDEKLFLIADLYNGPKLATQVWSSSDGVAWSMVYGNIDARFSAQFAISNETTLFAIGLEFDSDPPFAQHRVIWASDDGIVWAKLLHNLPVFIISAIIFYDSKLWVFAGYNATTDSNDIWNSTNGLSWTKVNDNFAVQLLGPSKSLSRFSIASFGGKMVLTGGVINENGLYQESIWSTTNGLDWINEGTGMLWPTREGHFSIAHNNQLWLGGGYGYKPTEVVYYDLFVSDNIGTWADVSSPNLATITSYPYVVQRIVSFSGYLYFVVQGADSNSIAIYKSNWGPTGSPAKFLTTVDMSIVNYIKATYTSNGVFNAGKIVCLNELGKIDASLIPLAGAASNPAPANKYLTTIDLLKLSLATGVSASGGAVDKGKIVCLNADGKIDSSMLPPSGAAPASPLSTRSKILNIASDETVHLLRATDISAGAANAWQVVCLNENGQLDISLF